MIKAHELRIGNKVLYKPYGNRDGEPVTIAGLMGMKAYFSKYSNESGMFHHLEPIPLTAELLKKCGFEAMIGGSDEDDPDYEATGWRAYYPASYMESGKGHFCIWDDQPGGYMMDNYSSAPLKYLHQLQNLYFVLTGEELQIQDYAASE